MVHFVTEIDFVDSDEVSDDVVQNYKKHLAETVQDAAEALAPDNQELQGRECRGRRNYGQPARANRRMTRGLPEA
jgi:hypothetical protein